MGGSRSSRGGNGRLAKILLKFPKTREGPSRGCGGGDSNSRMSLSFSPEVRQWLVRDSSIIFAFTYNTQIEEYLLNFLRNFRAKNRAACLLFVVEN